MTTIITTNSLNDNAAKHVLGQINELETSLVGLAIEVEGADKTHWRTKETLSIIADSEARKAELIAHLNECFNLDYSSELHMTVAQLEQALYSLKNCDNPEWRSAMWMSEEEAEKAKAGFKARVAEFKSVLSEKFGVIEDTLSSYE